jgi:tellurite methyltransferase
MKADETKWNKRYVSGTYPTDPNEIVQSYFRLARCGRALDIAAGSGRNSIFLADKGFTTEAVDVAVKGLEHIEAVRSDIKLIHQDLDTYQIRKNSYDLIVNINFLQRRLFPYIKAGLKHNGILIFQTFMDPVLTGGTCERKKKDRYLTPNELLHSFLVLQVILYEEKEVVFSNGEKLKTATLVARKNFR